MEFIKYFTNPQFNNAKFADMLHLQMNVRARAVEDGVILDRDAFNAMEAGLMPQWARLNKKAINSPLHTRRADPMEWPDLIHHYRYLLALISEDCDPRPLEQSDGLEYISRQADIAVNYCREEDGFCGVVVIDNDTGEIVYIAE